MSNHTQDAPDVAQRTEQNDDATTIQGAEVEQLETFTSSELTTQLAELRTRRDEMAAERDKTKAELAQAQKAIRFFKPKTVESATTLQARATVLENATSALSEEVAQLEGALQVALDAEQRKRAEEELAQLRADLEAQRQHLEAEGKRVAQELETNLRTLGEGMTKSWKIATAAHFKAQGLGHATGINGGFFAFGDGHLHQTLTDAGANVAVIQALCFALERLRLKDAIDEGIVIYPESVPSRIAAESGDTMPQPFKGFTVLEAPPAVQVTQAFENAGVNFAPGAKVELARAVNRLTK